MSYDRYRISIEVLENGFEVEVPDMEEIAKRKKESAKKSKDGCCPSMYFGDCTKKYAAKTLKEVQTLITAAMKQIPEEEYATAFDEAASKK